MATKAKEKAAPKSAAKKSAAKKATTTRARPRRKSAPKEKPYDPDAQLKVEAATERDGEGAIDNARMSTANAEQTDPKAPETFGPFKAPKAPATGTMRFEVDDRVYEPVACGEHRSAVAGKEPKGFQPKCEECQHQLTTLHEMMRQGR